MYSGQGYSIGTYQGVTDLSGQIISSPLGVSQYLNPDSSALVYFWYSQTKTDADDVHGDKRFSVHRRTKDYYTQPPPFEILARHREPIQF